MLSFILPLLAGVAVALGLRFTVVHSTAGAIFPAVVAAIGVAILLLRRTGKKLETVIEEVQRHVRGGRRELALKALRDALIGRQWHPMLEGQIRLQIGAMEYAAGNIDEAIPELKRSSARPWDGRALLGCAYYKQNDDVAMSRAFEHAVRAGKKDGLSWTVYAWCLSSRGKRDEAVAVLERGLKVLPTDERIQGNLEALRENRKMKVAPYGDRWSQFMLDGSVPGGVPKAARGFAQRPGFRQRPLRNKRKA